MAGREHDGDSEILKEIRDEIRNVRSEIRGLRGDTLERFGVIEAALGDLVQEGQSLALRLEPRVMALEARLGALESKV